MTDYPVDEIQLDEAARGGLQKFLDETIPRLQARDRALRQHGANAATAMHSFTTCPWPVGTYYWNRWMEGFTGTAAPERDYIAGKGFNMTPAEHVARYAEWLAARGLPADVYAEALRRCRAGYSADAFPREQ